MKKSKNIKEHILFEDENGKMIYYEEKDFFDKYYWKIVVAAFVLLTIYKIHIGDFNF